jgi:hypothetical protein
MRKAEDRAYQIKVSAKGQTINPSVVSKFSLHRNKRKHLPSNTASALLQASNVLSGRGTPWLSIAAPPKSCSSSWSERSTDGVDERRVRIRAACLVTSGPGDVDVVHE